MTMVNPKKNHYYPYLHTSTHIITEDHTDSRVFYDF